MLAILGQDQTLVQGVDHNWSVEHHSVWQAMTQAPSVVKNEDCLLTDKNREGIEKTGKRKINRMSAKLRELPQQCWPCYGSINDFGYIVVWDPLCWVDKRQPELILGHLLIKWWHTTPTEQCTGTI